MAIERAESGVLSAERGFKGGPQQGQSAGWRRKGNEGWEITG